MVLVAVVRRIPLEGVEGDITVGVRGTYVRAECSLESFCRPMYHIRISRVQCTVMK